MQSSFNLFVFCLSFAEKGETFGELGLLDLDLENVSSATVVADEVTDLMVVPRDLYNTTLKV